jgi:hypothetical protein
MTIASERISMKAAACFILMACVCTAQTAAPPVAGKLQLKTPGSALYATIGDAQVEVARHAVKAWLIDGGQRVIYSGKDGAGGYENEGQSLRVYEVATHQRKKILSARFQIDNVEERRSSHEKRALLVRMTDGGQGASHIAVVDPERGEVFSADSARFLKGGDGRILIGYFGDDDWDKLREGVKVAPQKTEELNLDMLLERPVINH